MPPSRRLSHFVPPLRQGAAMADRAAIEAEVLRLHALG